jgi:hypothetical protein
MNAIRCRPAVASVVSVFLIAITAQQSRADDVVINQFNGADEVAAWHFDYGSANVVASAAFSPQDAKNSAGSGSMAIQVTYGPAFQQAAFTASLPAPVNATTFSSLEFDVKVDDASGQDKFGNALYFQLALRNGSGFSYNKVFQDNVAVVSTNGGWRHVVVSPLTGGVDDVRAITLDLYDGNYASDGTAKIFVDNLKFTQPTPTVDVLVSKFDDSSETDPWHFDYGSPDIVNLTQFSTDDAGGDANSGSLEIQAGYGPGSPQAAFTANLPTPVDASTYLSLQFDVKVDPASALDPSGNAAYFQLALRVGAGFGYNKQFADNVAIVSTNNGWRHVVVSPLVGSVDDIRGITLDPYDGNYTAFNGPTILRLDNLKFTAPLTVTPPPPPTASLRPARPGLNLIPVGAFNRESIATHGDNLGWVGSAKPVKYAFTIGAYPDAAHSGFQTHVFLDPNENGPDTYADYNRPNIIFLDLQNQADGTTYAAFRYKTNEPQHNTFLYSAGTLGGVSCPTALGTWSMTFDHDTNVTLTAPNGATFSTNLPPAVAALFGGPLNVSLGAQANNNATVGETAVVTRFQITSGETALVDDHFDTDPALDTSLWQPAAVDAASVVFASPDSRFWLAWTLPDAGFHLQSASSLTNADAWTDSTLTGVTYATTKRVLLHTTDLPDTGKGFFRLWQPTAP